MVDPTAPACQTCGHEHCDELAKTCTGMDTLPPDAKNCGSQAAVAEMVLADAGACVAADVEKASTEKFSCDAVTCAKKSFFKLDKTASCLEQTNGISQPCANCFGQVSQCVLKNCAIKCMVDPTAPACQTCGHEHCDELAKTCTGMDTLPPDAKNCGSQAAVAEM